MVNRESSLFPFGTLGSLAVQLFFLVFSASPRFNYCFCFAWRLGGSMVVRSFDYRYICVYLRLSAAK
jgi:hypothetical protein